MTTRKLLIPLLLVLSALTLNQAHSAPSPSPSASPSTQPKETKLIWEGWYTVTVNEKIRYGYYHERIEKRGDRIFFQNDYWKKEEGYLNEEHLGAIAEDTPELAPLFFNFRSTYRTTEKQIDGNVTSRNKGRSKLLTVKIRMGDKELPIIKRGIGSKTIWSVFFPLWLNRNWGHLKPKKNLSFKTILEDHLELQYQTMTGIVRLLEPDPKSKNPTSPRVQVSYRNMPSIWTLDKDGFPARIELPQQSTLVERATESKAKQYLEE